MDAIKQCVEALIIGKPQAVEKLIMIPLSRGAFQPRAYKVLEEAISDETASVSEISEAGSGDAWGRNPSSPLTKRRRRSSSSSCSNRRKPIVP